MLKKISAISLYLAFAMLGILVLGYILEWFHFIEITNYLLFLFAPLCLLITIYLSCYSPMPWSLIYPSIGLIGSIGWLLCFTEHLDFQSHWNWAFTCIWASLFLALAGRSSQKKNKMLNLLMYLCLAVALILLFLTGKSYLSSPLPIVIALSLFTILLVVNYTLRAKKA
ncbi:MAG: hypothetical protein EP338_07660 [Bacteroidetes bacterium]|nr:MAG: hypothetical protein EP338_07660 [Bacteroidota bacterium]